MIATFNQYLGKSILRLKWICAALTLAILSECVTQPAYVPKTDDQINQEVLEKTIVDLKSRGASQAEVDRVIAHSKLSYEDQLKDSIKPSSISSPAENLVAMIRDSLFYCDLQRNSLKINISQDRTMKTEIKLAQCVVTTSGILSSYYYKKYVTYTPSNATKAVADEAYLKWGSYVDSILQRSPSYLQEQASLSVNDQVRRFQQVELEEILSKKK